MSLLFDGFVVASLAQPFGVPLIMLTWFVMKLSNSMADKDGECKL